VSIAVLLVLTVIVPTVVSYGTLEAQVITTVNGSVVNGSASSSIPIDYTVFLYAFGGSGDQITTYESKTNRAGSFEFDNVIVKSNQGYAISVSYGGMDYRVLLAEDDLGSLIKITVYEPTQDLSVIRVKMHSLIITSIDEKHQQIEAVEFITLSNTSDSSLIPDLTSVGQGQFSFLRFSLPSGTTEFNLQSDLVGGEIIPMGTGFAMTSPMSPGDHAISYSYKFPYTGDRVSFRQNLLQGANLYQVLIPKDASQPQMQGLTQMPDIDIEGTVYAVWEERNRSPKDGLDLHLVDLPTMGILDLIISRLSKPEFGYKAIPISVSAILVLIIGYCFYSSLKLKSVNNYVSTPTTRELLITEIAILDKQFEDGHILSEDYYRERASLGEKLISIIAVK
jgi:hypothetical protein